MPRVASSRTQEIYESLRADVVAGRFAPDEQVKPATVASRMNVSLGAVREALSRLSSECLVIAEPQRGFRVAPMSEADLVQLLEARKAIEELCLRSSIEGGDLPWESRVVAAYHHLSRVPERGVHEEVSQQWIDAHEAFHRALVSACDNEWLLRTRSILYIQCERYRSRLVVRGDQAGRDLIAEHRAIMDAAIARDADFASALLRKHYRDTVRDWVGRLRSRSEDAPAASRGSRRRREAQPA